MTSAVEEGACFLFVCFWWGGEAVDNDICHSSFLLSVGPGASKLYWVFQEPSTFVQMIIPNH